MSLCIKTGTVSLKPAAAHGGGMVRPAQKLDIVFTYWTDDDSLLFLRLRIGDLSMRLVRYSVRKGHPPTQQAGLATAMHARGTTSETPDSSISQFSHRTGLFCGLVRRNLAPPHGGAMPELAGYYGCLDKRQSKKAYLAPQI